MMVFENPIGNQIAWFGKQFMAGSGYEKRLHEEMIVMRKQIERTNELLEELIKATTGKKVKNIKKKK